MAPFLSLEWGKEGMLLMREIKDIFDPNHILNPGVILNDDPRVHVANLKHITPVPAARQNAASPPPPRHKCHRSTPSSMRVSNAVSARATAPRAQQRSHPDKGSYSPAAKSKLKVVSATSRGAAALLQMHLLTVVARA
jgi:hypothetical protein